MVQRYLKHVMWVSLRFDAQMLPVVPENIRTEILSLGSERFQHKDGPFEANDKDGRAMTKSWFKRKLLNGQEVNRSWLLYSPSRRSAYCFCCLLYSSASENSRSSFEFGQGFNNWKKTEQLSAHENSVNHRLAFRSWKEAERRIKEKAIIDVSLEEQINKEKENWRQVLKRVLDCIKFLTCQNLALHGHREKLELMTDTNVDNFLSLLNLVSHYDPIVKQHLEYAKQNPKHVSYLSPQVQNEFIQLLALSLRNNFSKTFERTSTMECYLTLRLT